MVIGNHDVHILTSMLDVGPYTALTIFSEIADIERFADSHKLCAYAGVVPSGVKFCRYNTPWQYNKTRKHDIEIGSNRMHSHSCNPC